MGRFHRHDDGTIHSHTHDDEGHALGHDDAHSHSHSHSVDAELQPHHHDHDLELIGDHSGYQTGPERIDVLERIFDENDAAAAKNRALLDADNVVAINLMSSPGAGKTTLLGVVLDKLNGQVRCGVVEGDIETSIDSDRLANRGAQIALLNTGNGFGGECHLDAPMVARALKDLDLASLDLLFIENVGNLVCPAEFDVGAHGKAMVYSVTEGEDKPLKYPVMFRTVETVIVNKIDLLPYLDFNLDLFIENLVAINPKVRIIQTSAKTGEGLDELIDWVLSQTR